MEYNRTAQISEIEWLIIQKFRFLLSNKFGNLVLVKVHKGNVTDVEQEIDIRVSLKDDADKLRELQR
jgi:hypothetical protein